MGIELGQMDTNAGFTKEKSEKIWIYNDLH
jgi:hypothetical protein